jgi:hypothetical protein
MTVINPDYLCCIEAQKLYNAHLQTTWWFTSWHLSSVCIWIPAVWLCRLQLDLQNNKSQIEWYVGCHKYVAKRPILHISQKLSDENITRYGCNCLNVGICNPLRISLRIQYVTNIPQKDSQAYTLVLFIKRHRNNLCSKFPYLFFLFLLSSYLLWHFW